MVAHLLLGCDLERGVLVNTLSNPLFIKIQEGFKGIQGYIFLIFDGFSW